MVHEVDVFTECSFLSCGMESGIKMTGTERDWGGAMWHVGRCWGVMGTWRSLLQVLYAKEEQEGTMGEGGPQPAELVGMGISWFSISWCVNDGNNLSQQHQARLELRHPVWKCHTESNFSELLPKLYSQFSPCQTLHFSGFYHLYCLSLFPWFVFTLLKVLMLLSFTLFTFKWERLEAIYLFVHLEKPHHSLDHLED